MATNVKIKEDIQELNVGSPLIQLFTLDLTPLGATGLNSILYFYPGDEQAVGSTPILFNTVPYLPIPVEVEGFEYPGDGKMPRPTIRISNLYHTFLTSIIDYDDIVGAKFTRRRTFKKYLDGEDEADSNAQFPTDVYYVERKTKQNRNLIEWELISILDVENLLVPKRQALGICTHRYGIGQSWATCPYAGAGGYFTEDGISTTAPDDKCGKKLFDCQLRYGENTKLPFRGFPGIGTVGTPYRR